VRTGGVEPPQHEATGLQPAELTVAQRPHELRVAGRARTGANGDHNPGCFRLHHGHHESGDDRTRTGGLSPDKRVLCTSELRPRRKRWKAGSAPRNRRQRRCRLRAPEPAVAHRRSCQRMSTPPPPHRLALEACRSQLHVRARALHQPLFRHFLGPSVDGPILIARAGFEPAISSS
jgi:hypothetical protein